MNRVRAVRGPTRAGGKIARVGGGCIDKRVVTARQHLEHLGAQEALGSDPGLGPLPHMNVLIDPKSDKHTRPVEFNARHLPRGKAGDFDCGAGEQTPGVGEVSRVVLALAQKRQLLVVQRGQCDHDHRRNADEADDHGAALRERFHFGAHRPVV